MNTKENTKDFLHNSYSLYVCKFERNGELRAIHQERPRLGGRGSKNRLILRTNSTENVDKIKETPKKIVDVLNGCPPTASPSEV